MNNLELVLRSRYPLSMAIKSTLRHGDILQFPSHALKKIVQVLDDWIIFCSLKDSKKRSTYSEEFVLKHCDLLPEKVDLQYYLNTTHDRRSAIEVKAVTVDAYSDANTLKGYKIEDEIIDYPQEVEE